MLKKWELRLLTEHQTHILMHMKKGSMSGKTAVN